MHTPSFFERSDLTRALWAFRREFFVVGLFSMVANLLMLTPTLYMLQVYDRVMLSGSDLTLLAVSLICLFLLGVMGTAEWFRSRLLVRVGVAIGYKDKDGWATEGWWTFQPQQCQSLLKGDPAGINATLTPWLLATPFRLRPMMDATSSHARRSK